MSVENLKSFQEKLLKDESLQTKVKEKVAALENKPESEEIIVETILVPTASEENLPFSMEDYQSLKQEKNTALSEEELEAISGGSEPMVGVIVGFCLDIGYGYGNECKGTGKNVGCLIVGGW